MIKAVIFDLWNTLAYKDRSVSGTLKKTFGINDPHFFSIYENALYTRRFSTIDDYASKFLQTFDIQQSEKSKEQIKQTIQNSQSQLFPSTLDSLGELKDYKLGLLSNTSQYEIVPELEKHFDVINYSFDTGLLKPDVKAFDRIAEELGVAKEECLFVDDLATNIQPAYDSGISTYHVKEQSRLPTLGKKLQWETN